MEEFYSEIKHYMGIPILVSKAKQELNIIVMQPAETVNKYYHQIFKLWQQANIPDNQRIEKFKLTLKLSISIPLLASKHNSLREFFDAAQLIKKQRKKISSNFSGRESIKQASAAAALNKTFKPWKNPTAAPATSAIATENASTANRNRLENITNPNARFILTAIKPLLRLIS